MAEIQDLLATDASNIARWPENMPFSGVNDAGRADEGILARWYQDTNGSITASGSANAFAITSNRTIAAYFNNLLIAFTANFSITGATTLNLNGLGAKGLKRYNGNDLAQGDIISGQPVVVLYKSSPDVWYMVSGAATVAAPVTYVDFAETSPANPAADTARLYALDDSGTTRMAFRDSAGVISTFYPSATAAEMEALTANRLVAVALQHRHPGHPKAWIAFNGTGTVAIVNDYGVATLTDNGTGDYILTWDTTIASLTAYPVVGSIVEISTAGNSTFELVAQSSTTTEVATHFATSGGGRADASLVCASMFGDQ